MHVSAQGMARENRDHSEHRARGVTTGIQASLGKSGCAYPVKLADAFLKAYGENFNELRFDRAEARRVAPDRGMSFMVQRI